MPARPFSSLLLLATWLLLPAVALAQSTPSASITGRVVDAESGTPLAGAHVFIASSMMGTTTGPDGRYVLDRVPLGAHRLYVSLIGYEPAKEDLMLREGRPYPIDFDLPPAVVELDGITVTGERDPKWQRRLEKFTRLFVGETRNAEATTILNPEVLDFEEKLGRFTARASEPLIIENRALGYRVRYFLKEFTATPTRISYDGEPLFEPLEATSPEEQAEWDAHRLEAFLGSFRHFILAVFAGRVEEQGFRLYHRPPSGPAAAAVPLTGSPLTGRQRFPLKASDLYRAGEVPTERVLDYPGFAEVIYMGEVEDDRFLAWQERQGRPGYQTSMLLLENGPAVVDDKGSLLDPYGVTFFGYLAFERVADEVPKEYRPR